MLGRTASPSLLMAKTAEAPAAEPEHAAQAEGDIWLDQATMEYLKLQEGSWDLVSLLWMDQCHLHWGLHWGLLRLQASKSHQC